MRLERFHVDYRLIRNDKGFCMIHIIPVSVYEIMLRDTGMTKKIEDLP